MQLLQIAKGLKTPERSSDLVKKHNSIPPRARSHRDDFSHVQYKKNPAATRSVDKRKQSPGAF